MKAVGWVLFAAVVPATLHGQLAERIGAVENGIVRFAFEARPGVCGDGVNSYRQISRSSEDWESSCDGGPVRVSVERRDGETATVRFFVGGRWRARASATDLGTVPPAEASRFLVTVFERHDSRSGRRALEAAGLGVADDGWNTVLQTVRREDRSERSRRAGMTWLASAAGRRIDDGTRSDDHDVRRRAIFALSQLPRDESVPRLVRVVEENRSPALKRHALFWLGQTGDTRALPPIERILSGRS